MFLVSCVASLVDLDENVLCVGCWLCCLVAKIFPNAELNWLALSLTDGKLEYSIVLLDDGE